MKIIDTTKFNELLKDSLENKKFFLIDFYAEWCGPCKILGKTLEQIEKDNYSQYKDKFYKVDIDASYDLSEKYNIQAVPTLKIFKDGEEKDSLYGIVSESALKQFIQKYT